VRLALTLCLPRDAITVPVSRHVCHSALAELGATDDVISDIEIALAEACTNVLDHAGPGDEYEVTAEVSPEVCVIRVIDTGRGFDAARLRRDADDGSAERGRGVTLMKALVDQVSFVSKDEVGTLVHLEKRLTFHDAAPMQRLGGTNLRP
jgi:serine/threonine-protein kinase RsbW